MTLVERLMPWANRLVSCIGQLSWVSRVPRFAGLPTHRGWLRFWKATLTITEMSTRSQCDNHVVCLTLPGHSAHLRYCYAESPS